MKRTISSVSSVAANYGKSNFAKYSGLLATTCMVGLAIANTNAQAAPTGGNVVGGNASITVSGTATNITQTSNRAAIDWNSFNVAANESVNFSVPNGGATLNRVTGGTRSLIEGNITSNGTLYLVNPNGLVFAVGSSVSAKNFIASTSNIDPTEFMRGDHIALETSNTNARISLNGTITVADRGIVGIFAPQVENQGIITANLGSITLAGVQSSVIDFTGDGLINFELGESQSRTGENLLSSNKGIIAAAGGRVTLTAQGAEDLFNAVVENTGSINANSLTAQGGSVTLKANHGNITDSGTISASGTHGGGNVMVFADGNTNYTGTIHAEALAGDKKSDGGQVEVSGKQTIQFMGTVSTHSFNGGRLGSLLIDPTNVVIVATAPASGSTPISVSGNNFTANGADANSYVLTANLITALQSNDVTVDATTTGSPTDGTGTGTITVSDPISWDGTGKLTLKAKGGITINAAITSTKATGGLADLTLDSSAGTGGITLTKDITAGVVTINSGAGISGGTVAQNANFATAATGLVNAATLNITGGGSAAVTLYGAIANISGVAGAAIGHVSITSSQAVTVTGAVNMLAANKNFTLVTTNGNITLNAAVSALNLSLNAAAAIDGTGTISTGGLSVNATGAVTLSGGFTNFNIVNSANFAGTSITLSNRQGVLIYSDLNLGNANFSLTTTGSGSNITFDVNSSTPKLITTGTVTLVSTGTIRANSGGSSPAPITAAALNITANGEVKIGGGAIGTLAGFTQNATSGTNNVEIKSTSNMNLATHIINTTGTVTLASSGHLIVPGVAAINQVTKAVTFTAGNINIDAGTNVVSLTASNNFTVAAGNKLTFLSNNQPSTAVINLNAGGFVLTPAAGDKSLDIGAAIANFTVTGALDSSVSGSTTTGAIVVAGSQATATALTSTVLTGIGFTAIAKTSGGLVGGQNIFVMGANNGLVPMAAIAKTTGTVTEVDNFTSIKGAVNVFVVGVGTSGSKSNITSIASPNGSIYFAHTASVFANNLTVNAGGSIQIKAALTVGTPGATVGGDPSQSLSLFAGNNHEINQTADGVITVDLLYVNTIAPTYSSNLLASNNSDVKLTTAANKVGTINTMGGKSVAFSNGMDLNLGNFLYSTDTSAAGIVITATGYKIAVAPSASTYTAVTVNNGSNITFNSTDFAFVGAMNNSVNTYNGVLRMQANASGRFGNVNFNVTNTPIVGLRKTNETGGTSSYKNFELGSDGQFFITSPNMKQPGTGEYIVGSGNFTKLGATLFTPGTYDGAWVSSDYINTTKPLPLADKNTVVTSGNIYIALAAGDALSGLTNFVSTAGKVIITSANVGAFTASTSLKGNKGVEFNGSLLVNGASNSLTVTSAAGDINIGATTGPYSGTLSLNASALNFTASSGSLNVNQAANFSGATNLTAGNIKFKNAVTITGAATLESAEGGTITLDAATIITGTATLTAKTSININAALTVGTVGGGQSLTLIGNNGGRGGEINQTGSGVITVDKLYINVNASSTSYSTNMLTTNAAKVKLDIAANMVGEIDAMGGDTVAFKNGMDLILGNYLYAKDTGAAAIVITAGTTANPKKIIVKPYATALTAVTVYGSNASGGANITFNAADFVFTNVKDATNTNNNGMLVTRGGDVRFNVNNKPTFTTVLSGAAPTANSVAQVYLNLGSGQLYVAAPSLPFAAVGNIIVGSGGFNKLGSALTATNYTNPASAYDSSWVTNSNITSTKSLPTFQDTNSVKASGDIYIALTTDAKDTTNLALINYQSTSGKIYVVNLTSGTLAPLTHDVTLQGYKGIEFGGAMNLGANKLTLTAESGGIIGSGKITAGSLTGSASGNVNLVTNIVNLAGFNVTGAYHNFTLQNDSALTVTGTLQVNANASLTTLSGNLTLTKDIYGTNANLVSAGSLIGGMTDGNGTINVNTGNLSLSAHGTITLYSGSNTGFSFLTGFSQTGTGVVTLHNKSSHPLTISAAVDAQANELNITSYGALVISNEISGGTVNLTSTTKGITTLGQNGKVTATTLGGSAAESVNLAANVGNLIGFTVTGATHGFTLSNDGPIQVSNNQSASSFTLTAASITLGANITTKAGGSGITLASKGGITIATPSVTLDGGGNVVNINAGGAITIIGGNKLSFVTGAFNDASIFNLSAVTYTVTGDGAIAIGDGTLNLSAVLDTTPNKAITDVILGDASFTKDADYKATGTAIFKASLAKKSGGVAGGQNVWTSANIDSFLSTTGITGLVTTSGIDLTPSSVIAKASGGKVNSGITLKTNGNIYVAGLGSNDKKSGVSNITSGPNNWITFAKSDSYFAGNLFVTAGAGGITLASKVTAGNNAVDDNLRNGNIALVSGGAIGGGGLVTANRLSGSAVGNVGLNTAVHILDGFTVTGATTKRVQQGNKYVNQSVPYNFSLTNNRVLYITGAVTDVNGTVSITTTGSESLLWLYNGVKGATVNLSSGKHIYTDAYNSEVAGTGLVTASTLNVTASGNVKLYGAISTLGALNLKNDTGKFSVESSTTMTVTALPKAGRGDVSLATADGSNLILGKGIKAFNNGYFDITLKSGYSLNLSAANAITSLSRVTLVAGGGGLSVAAAIKGEYVSLNSGAGMTVTGAINGHDVRMNSKAGLTVTGALNAIFLSGQAVGNVVLNANVGNLHGFTVTGTGNGFTLNNTGSLNVTSAVTATSAVTLNATEIELSSNITTTSAGINLTSSGGNITVSGTDVTLDANGNAINLNASGNISIATGNKLKFLSNGGDNVSTINFAAGGFVVADSGAISIGGGTLNVNTIIDTKGIGDIILVGSSGISDYAATGTSIKSAANAITTGGFAAKQNVWTAADLDSAGSSGATLVTVDKITGSVISTKNAYLYLKTDGNIYIAGLGTQAAPNKLTSISTGGSKFITFDKADSFFASDVTVTAGTGGININSGVNVGTNKLNLASGGGIKGTGLVTAKDLTGNANGNVSLTTALSNLGQFTVTGTTNKPVKQGTKWVNVPTPNSFSLSNAKALTVTGAVAASGTLALTTTGSTGTAPDPIVPNGITLNHDLAGSTVTLISVGAITSAASSASNTGNGLIKATNLSVTATGSVTIYGGFTNLAKYTQNGTGDLSLHDSQGLTITAALGDKTNAVSLTTTNGDILLSQAVTGSTVTLSASGMIYGGTQTIRVNNKPRTNILAGTVNAATLNLTAKGLVKVTGDIATLDGFSQKGSGEFTLNSTNDLTVNGNLAAGANVVNLTSAKNVTLAANITGTSGIAVTSGGDLTITGLVSLDGGYGKTVNLTAAKALAIADGNKLTFVAYGATTIDTITVGSYKLGASKDLISIGSNKLRASLGTVIDASASTNDIVLQGSALIRDGDNLAMFGISSPARLSGGLAGNQNVWNINNGGTGLDTTKVSWTSGSVTPFANTTGVTSIIAGGNIYLNGVGTAKASSLVTSITSTGGNITFAGTDSYFAGNLVLSSGGAITSSARAGAGLVNANTISGDAFGAINLAGAIANLDGFKQFASGIFSVKSTVGMNVKATPVTRSNGATGDIVLGAGGALNLGNFAINNGSHNVTLASGTNMVLAAANTITTTGTVTLNSGGGISGTGLITANTLTGSAKGVVSLNSKVSNLGKFTVAAGSVIKNKKPTPVYYNFALTNDGDLTLAGALSNAGGGVSLSNTGNIDIASGGVQATAASLSFAFKGSSKFGGTGTITYNKTGVATPFSLKVIDLNENFPLTLGTPKTVPGGSGVSLSLSNN